MVASQPQLRNGTELMVLGYLLGVQVTVVVYDGQFLCVIVKKMHCSFVLQQEILMNERFHIIGF
jgi:hypothetical protein